MLIERNIDVVLVSPPYYWDCFENSNSEQKMFIKDYISSLCNEYPVHYVDLESDKSFSYDDFFNETHLSEIGAEKFTKILYEYIKGIN